MARLHLIGLDPTVYEHPFDQAALNTLRKLPGFDTATNFILNWTAVKWNLVAMQGSNFHVTRESCPELYNQAKLAAQLLGVEDVPEIYTEWGYAVNGYTTGNKDKTMLVLNSGAVDLLTEGQLNYVVGHEMGHIKSGHVLYHLMAQLFSSAIGLIPLGETLLTPTKIYVKPMMALFDAVKVKGVAHITGGGFYENVPRMLKDGVRAVIKKDSYPVPPIFPMMQKKGEIDETIMYNTFNMGIGMVVAVDAADAEKAMEAMRSAGDTPYIIGSIEAGEKGVTLC